MSMRSAALLLTGVLIATSAAAACAPEDTDSLQRVRPRRSSDNGSEGGDEDREPNAPRANPREEDKPSQELDAGAPVDIDPAPPVVVDAAPSITAFSNAAEYALLTPSKQSGDHHGGDSNAGKDCLLCHTGSGAPKFVLGGTVYTTKGSNTGARAVQVRVVGPNGEEIALVGTDSSGNFWLKGTIDIPPGSRVGVRDGTRTKLMGATIGVGSCNQSNCHVSPTRPIYLSD